MDYYFDSEVIESLNILRPPVKRDTRNPNRVFAEHYNSTIINYCEVQQDCNQKFRKSTKYIEKEEKSSTSLILEKSSRFERQIFNQNSSPGDHNNRCQPQETIPKTENKPLIHITVIPKTNHLTSRKVLRKQRVVTKPLKATSSNHENSVQTNNLYLVVAGRKKDKIYEIKTTDSVNFKPEQIKHGAVVTECDIKQYIRTMERKKKKLLKKEPKNNQNKCQTQGCKYIRNIQQQYSPDVCDCLSAEEDHFDVPDSQSCSFEPEGENVHGVHTGKSKVRIFGRLGLTEGLKYVLNCQATVDDKPVPISTSLGEKYIDEPTQRDFVTQTEYRDSLVNKLLMDVMKNKTGYSKDSQSTQVNFNNPNDNNKTRITNCTRNRSMECNCSQDENLANITVNTENEEKNLKSCQHPLVIISVFPKQDHNKQMEHRENDDNNFNNLVKTVQCAQLEKLTNALINREEFPENNPMICRPEDENENVMTKRRVVRSRSPSPRSVKYKLTENKIIGNTKYEKTTTRNQKPHRSKAPKKEKKKGTSTPKQTLEFFNSNVTKEATKKTRKLSPSRSPGTKSPITYSYKKEPRSKKSKSPKRKVDIGVNTEHLEAKKALIESYTKTICEQMTPIIEKPPVTSVSKISVNIDNAKEYYDVSFVQNKYTTDVSVRKTKKDTSAQKCSNGNRKCGTMEDFLPTICKKQHKSSISQSIYENQSDDVEYLPNRKLTLRDSIELIQRRDDKNMKTTQTRRNTEFSENNDMDFLAPIKHFTGDSCTICDPIERDREIRELLGVEGRRPYTSDSQTQELFIGDPASRHCFYPSQWDVSVESVSVNDYEIVPYTKSNRYSKQRQRNSRLSDQPNKIQTKVKPKAECQQALNSQIIRKQKTDSEQRKYRSSVECVNTNTENLNDSGSITTYSTNHNKTYCFDPTPPNQQHASIAASLYQHLTLNRNIQVFLQVDQFKKEKPTSLTREQYKKVKRTIQNTLQAKENRCSAKHSIVSVGPVKEKHKQSKYRQYTYKKIQELEEEKNNYTSADKQNNINKICQDTNAAVAKAAVKDEKFTQFSISGRKEQSQIQQDTNTLVLFSKEVRDSLKDQKPPSPTGSKRHAVSSVEVKFSNVEYLKQVTFSTTNVGSVGSLSLANRNHYSIETLFRGHRKTVTPNLGTSALSLVSGSQISQSDSVKIAPPDTKAKKPFLKRLMSCLVMRSSRASEMQIKNMVVSQPSVNSSIDSYHLSTSFGGIEMTSSIYDTSVSFCSSHSIHPLSSKLKRGFLTSVRGFLTNRKS